MHRESAKSCGFSVVARNENSFHFHIYLFVILTCANKSMRLPNSSSFAFNAMQLFSGCSQIK